LRYIAIEGSNRRERHFNEPMPARPFHELSDSVCIIDVHDHVQALSTGNPYAWPSWGEHPNGWSDLMTIRDIAELTEHLDDWVTSGEKDFDLHSAHTLVMLRRALVVG